MVFFGSWATWTIWLVAALLLVIAEMLTLGFFLIWFGIAALAAALVALLQLGLIWQLAAFALVGLVLTVYTRPLALRYFKQRQSRTNIDAFTGEKAIVETRLEPGKPGRVRYDGRDWRALPVSDEPIEEGATVVIESVRGVTLMVSERTAGPAAAEEEE